MHLCTQALKACEAKGEHLTSLFLHASACHALVLEALGRAGAAEQVLRDVYIDLDRQLGPRHPRTLEFMAHLGRSVSRMEGRCVGDAGAITRVDEDRLAWCKAAW